MFIVSVDGVDCTGKSTYCRKLAATYKNNVKIVHFPRYDTKIGEIIKKELESENPSVDFVQALCIEDMILFKKELDESKFDEYDVLILDRSILSTIAYCDNEFRRRFIDFIVKEERVVKPNLSIVFAPDSKKSISILRNRINNKSSKDGFENFKFLIKVNDSFKELCNNYKNIFNIERKEINNND